MNGYSFRGLLLLFCLLPAFNKLFAQLNGQGANTPNGVPRVDTTNSKTNTGSWPKYEERLSFKKLNSEQTHYPDTSIHLFHRRPYSQPWYRDLGNLGSPVQNLLFTPEYRTGPTLGFHVFDVYRILPDSLNYYNTLRPYSSFTYQLGSKLEQMADILISENVKPNWNFTAEYKKINSGGYYKIQRTNHDIVFLTTNYKSLNQRYELYGGIIYNEFQHDENGGINADSQLTNINYADKKTVDVRNENSNYSLTRSSVTNYQRDFTVLLQNSYTLGRTDTFYNQDSTQYTYKLTPRFRLTHKMELSTEKHEFKDLVPDSLRYLGFFNHGFSNGGYFTQGQDSVFAQHLWFWVDNKVLVNGFVGKAGHQLAFSAGVGNRMDEFTVDDGTSHNQTKVSSYYLTGEIKKEALHPGEWFCNANTQFFLTGDNSGNFILKASAGKDLKSNWAGVVAGFQQTLSSAPFSYTIFRTQYDTIAHSFDKESVSQVYGTLSSPKLRFSAGVRNYLLGNYIYLNQQQLPDQFKTTFNITQVWMRKLFKLGILHFDNELVYQQATGNATINVPKLMGRHQLSIEASLFKSALKIATGIDIRYHTAYYGAGYSTLFNKFYYQDTYYLDNRPEASLFFNFRIKRFRAYIMGDQLQELFARNNINLPGYPAQDAMIRFGFSWVMIN